MRPMKIGTCNTKPAQCCPQHPSRSMQGAHATEGQYDPSTNIQCLCYPTRGETKTITTCVITKVPMPHGCSVHVPVIGSVTQALSSNVFVILQEGERTKTITTCVITKLPMHHRCRVHMPVTGSVTQALTTTVFVIPCKTITTRVITKVPRHQRCRVHMPVTGSVTQALLSNVFVIPLKDEPKTITTRVITNVPRHQRYRVHMPVTGNVIQALTSYVIVKNTPVTAKTKRTSDQERWHCPAPHEKASPASCNIPQAALKELNLHMQAAPHNAAPRAESLCSLLMTRFVTTARPEILSCRQWGRESGTAVCESCEGTRTSKTCEQRQRRGGRQT
jgi:hypothetical protein